LQYLSLLWQYVSPGPRYDIAHNYSGKDTKHAVRKGWLTIPPSPYLSQDALNKA
jgi:hypothetical protein